MELKQRKVSDASNSVQPAGTSKGKNITSSVLDLKRASSIIVEENLNLNVEPGNSRDHLIRRSSEPGFPSKPDKRKSSSNSDCSEMHTDEETYVNLHIIRENSIAERNESASKYDKNDIFCSSTSEFEMLDSNQQFLG